MLMSFTLFKILKEHVFDVDDNNDLMESNSYNTVIFIFSDGMSIVFISCHSHWCTEARIKPDTT